MRIFENIKTNIKESERREGGRYVYDLDITTESYRVHGLSDVELARVLQAFKILDSHRFLEVQE
jgi:hypothetical protein